MRQDLNPEFVSGMWCFLWKQETFLSYEDLLERKEEERLGMLLYLSWRLKETSDRLEFKYENNYRTLYFEVTCTT